MVSARMKKNLAMIYALNSLNLNTESVGLFRILLIFYDAFLLNEAFKAV
jgi:hypothetical protein